MFAKTYILEVCNKPYITNFDITKIRLKYYLANDCEIFSLLKEKNVKVEYADTINSKRTKTNRTSPKWCKITKTK